MTGLLIGNKHTYDDFGMKMLSFTISAPKIIEEKIEVPGRAELLDLSEFFGKILYKERTLNAEFDVEEINPNVFANRFQAICNYMHGISHEIVCDQDDQFYYKGRISVSYTQINSIFYKIKLSATVSPYKYKLTPTIVSEFIADQAQIICPNLRKEVVPTITTDADFQIEFDGESYSISAGENIIPEILFRAGDNILTCTGSGTITFTYQEGSL